MSTDTLTDRPHAREEHGSDVADAVEEAVEQQPWVQPVTRLGWLAKGAVYALMGLTAFEIGRHRPTVDDASPEGAVAQVVSTRFGVALLALLAIGLILYAAWRVLTVLLIKGNGLHEWGDRVGYTFSAAFYTIVAVTAVSAVLHGDQPEDSNTIEHLSRSMLESSVGRWVLFVGGAVAAAIGGYFVVKKGVERSFRDELDLSNSGPHETRAIMLTGSVGWVGRGVITCAIGWFVMQSAWQVDASDARGFDRAFRELASSGTGSIAVCASGVALVIYGVFCVLSIRHLELEAG